MSGMLGQLPSAFVHPMVILSAADHHSRIFGEANRRSSGGKAVGMLLGKRAHNCVVATNSFAVPFEVDSVDEDVWFLDHAFAEQMGSLFVRVSTKERLIGWYHTGGKLDPQDSQIHALIQKHVPSPVLVVIHLDSKDGRVADAYFCRGEDENMALEHIHSEIRIDEPEEIAVEHLLKDVKTYKSKIVSALPISGAMEVMATESMATRLSTIGGVVKNLSASLEKILRYLDIVVSGEMEGNERILVSIQEIICHIQYTFSNPIVTKQLLDQQKYWLSHVLVGSQMKAVMAIHDLAENAGDRK